MARIIYFLFFIFFIDFVSSTSLVVSPEEIVFEGESGEVICDNLSITVDGFRRVLLDDRWAESGFMERKLSAHRLESDDVGLDLFYDSELVVDDDGEIEVCLRGKKGGDFHGVLLFRGEGISAGVGVWLVVHLEGGEGVVDRLGQSVLGITGGIVGVAGKGVGIDLLIILFLVFLVLLQVFILVWRRKKVVL